MTLDPKRYDLAIKQLQKRLSEQGVAVEKQIQIVKVVEETLGNFKRVTAQEISAILGDFEVVRADIADFNKILAEDVMIRGDFLAKDINAATGSFSYWLTGVNIVGDNIIGGTISTDRLIIRDPDTNRGILYEINNGIVDQTELSEEELKRVALDGRILVAESVTADKINVTDLFSQNITVLGDFALGGGGALVYDSESDELNIRAKSIKIESNDVATKEDIENVDSKIDSEATSIRDEIIEHSSSILETAEEITMGILAGYTTVSDLETYKKEIENLFSASEEGFSFEFNQLSEKLTNLGNEISNQQQYIRLVNGEIHIGDSNSPVTSVYTNDALEFRYNGNMVARFTNEVLEVRNISAENQVAFFNQWAIRKGAYITGKGYNLNDIWIGG